MPGAEVRRDFAAVLRHISELPGETSCAMLHISPAFDVNAGAAAAARQLVLVKRQQQTQLALQRDAECTVRVSRNEQVANRHEAAKLVLDDVMERLPPMISLMSRTHSSAGGRRLRRTQRERRARR